MEGDKGSWFGSLFSAVKAKSTQVFEMVKNDFEEIGTAVRNEASNVVTSTGAVLEKTISLTAADTAASSVKKSFSTFIDQVNTVLNPGLDEEDDSEDILIFQGSELVAPTKMQRAVFDLQNCEKTYMTEPHESVSKVFECWLEINQEQLADDRTSKHLSSSVFLQKFHKKLVPEAISDEQFWRRYLFKKALLEDEINSEEERLERGKIAEQKQAEMQSKTKEGDDGVAKSNGNNIKWEQEEFPNDIELSEEEQIKLLEEYEKETKQRNLKSNKRNSQIFTLQDELACVNDS